jgi:cytochrome c biogenesis protein CcdA
MRDHFSLLISPVLVLLGAVLVYDGAVSQDVSQSMRVIAGAALLALGLILVQFTFRNWLKERARMPRNRSREA